MVVLTVCFNLTKWKSTEIPFFSVNWCCFIEEDVDLSIVFDSGRQPSLRQVLETNTVYATDVLMYARHLRFMLYYRYMKTFDSTVFQEFHSTNDITSNAILQKLMKLFYTPTYCTYMSLLLFQHH
ncbi:hypothetical protein T4D_13590 [Trichinella pseudospiralis]|uniref:Uncharacterized protein n=1 Tax=Trichinella pseudospiralis TaxID=6337 RepID=A0A0V1F2W0_TRIPS|nr:hypothetical protein T4D_13590 [Trichinella pseudospiralis]